MEGTDYVRVDLTLNNVGDELFRTQFGPYAACLLAKDSPPNVGVAQLTPGLMAQCLGNSGDAISLVANSPDPTFSAGHYTAVRAALREPLIGTEAADRCWVQNEGLGECGRAGFNPGMGVAWNAELEPGESVTRSVFLSFTDRTELADLGVDARVTPERARLGDPVTYAVTVSNQGPDPARDVTVALAPPPGVELTGHPAEYDPDTGMWTIPRIDAGASTDLALVGYATQTGDLMTRVTAAQSTGMDVTPCQPDTANCGPELTVHVDGRGDAAQSTIAVAPEYVTADGETEATVTVTVRSTDGHVASDGNDTVQLSSTLGTLSEVTNRGDEQYVASLVSERAGDATLGFSVNGEEAAQTAITNFVAGPVDPQAEASSYTVSEGDRVVGTKPHTVTVRLADRSGNPVSGEATALRASSVDALGAGSISAFTESAKPGSYDAEIHSTSAGDKMITVSLDGTQLAAQGNRSATFVPGTEEPAEPRAAFTVSSDAQTVGTGRHTVTVSLRDAAGAGVTGQADALAAASEDSLGSGAITDFTERAPGDYVAEVSSTVAGTKRVTVSHAGNAVPAEGNASARFVAGAVSLDQEDSGYSVTEGTERWGPKPTP